MHAQPLIAVRDVQVSSHWYQTLLGCKSGHGGSEYEQIIYEGRMIMQLHHWDAHEHPHMGNQNLKPYGNGVLLWFQTDEFDKAVERADVLHAEILEEPKVNFSANHREFWLRDPDGYVVVITGRYGDLDMPQKTG
jgi:extradiol dioxygenase family protein